MFIYTHRSCDGGETWLIRVRYEVKLGISNECDQMHV